MGSVVDLWYPPLHIHEDDAPTFGCPRCVWDVQFQERRAAELAAMTEDELTYEAFVCGDDDAEAELERRQEPPSFVTMSLFGARP